VPKGKTYQRVVFMQGEEAEEPLRILDEGGVGAALDHLCEWWDGSEDGETSDTPASGTEDDVHRAGEWRLTWNTSLGYIGLERVQKAPGGAS
jgi:hypothetical protein